ncbi:GtrA family protein [Candidatus Falkowbacteria bacterium]|nr:GtrA family protein [Candidatus Falkowbacteria bacterium]
MSILKRDRSRPFILFVKYSLTGALVTSCELYLLYFLVDISKWFYLPASALSFGLGLLASFFLRKLWVFKNDDWHDTFKQFGWYSFILVINIAFNIGLMYWLVELLRLNYLLAQFFSGALLGILSFLFNKTVTFHLVTKTATNLPKALAELKHKT